MRCVPRCAGEVFKGSGFEIMLDLRGQLALLAARPKHHPSGDDPSSNCGMSSEVTALATAAAEADKVVKKQKVCSNKFASAVDSLLAVVNDSKDKLQNGKTDSVLTELKHHVTQLGIPSELYDQTKQLHQAVAKLGKVSDLHFSIA